MRGLPVVTALAAACVLSGCGQSEEERVQQVVREYTGASADGDAEKACALTAPEMFAASGGTCEDFVRINSLPDRRQAGLRQAAGTYVVTLDGDRARAEGHNLGIFDLRKIDGDWKLTAVR
jgi:hypothetical protein